MKLLVVDDHALIREAMRGVLKELNSEIVVLEAATYKQAVELVQSNLEVSLVLLDLQLPDHDGLNALVEFREKSPAIAVAMISAHNDRSNVVKALESGAVGFIPKTASRDVLLNALRLILAGSIYVPPEILHTDTLAVKPVPTTDGRKPTPTELGLTERQVDVLTLMMQGKSNKLICRALDLAEPTVKNHVSAILKALSVSNRTEAVLAVTDMGWELTKPNHR